MSAATSLPRNATVLGLTVSVVCTTFVVWVVNALIYSARWEFIALHPERTARKSPTISRAISDPRIGEPFAEWMAICAPVLFVGVALLVWAGLHELRRNGTAEPQTLRWFLRMSCVLVVLQAMASVGLVMLSHWRFPDHHAGHMAGSYLFFFSQAAVVFVGHLVSNGYGRLPPQGRVMLPVMAQVRRVYVWVPILLAVVYLSCFILKDFDFGAISKPLFTVYVSTEPMLLSSFLFYVLSFVPDSVVTILRYVRGSSLVSA
ncbi:Frag1/DRAM/Sfk1 family protein [Shimia sp. SK013]|uniref:hypothetical protein n=1 Tax=Shimia sp. SK013 TaxID=1389006 RepID=UPI0006B52D33|nr:hypothetical protein [Shimia sp. SK013]KPA19960.1 Frag1/DRAM/Sfk1 family protein [Shimia sp. SK013]